MEGDIDKIKERLKENQEALHISRIPYKTKKSFIELANQEFCGDYGFLLKYLMDDIIGQDTRMIIAKIQEHEGRIEALENSPKSGDVETLDTYKKMLDGSVKSVREVEKNE